MKYYTLIRTLLFLVLIVLNNSAKSQNCYQIEIDHVGAEAFTHDMLETAACDLVDLIEYSGSDPFKVLAFNLYPILGAVDKNMGLDYNLNLIDGILADKGYYLAIIKKVNYEEDTYALSPNHSVEYIIKYNLPATNSNINLSDLDKAALQKVLQNRANQEIKETGNTIITEISLMQELGNSLNGLSDEENLDILGYTFVPSQNIDQIRSSSLPNPLNNQFSLIELKDNNGSWISLSSLAPTSVDIYSNSLNVNLITSSSLDDTSISLANNQLQMASNDVVNIHIHHDATKDGLYFISKLTKTTSTQILNAELQSRLVAAGYDVNFNGGGITKPGEGSRNEDWNFAKKFMTDNPVLFAQLFPTEASAYGASIGCGLVDGLTTSIEMLWDLIKGTTQTGSGIIVTTASYFLDAFVDTAKVGIWYAVTNIGVDVYKASSEAWTKIKNAAAFISGALANVTQEMIGVFLKKVFESVTKWFKTFISYTTEGGYQVGKLAFEIILNFFTAGAGSGVKAAKYLDEIMVLFAKWDLDGIAKNLNNILKAAEDVGDQAKKILKCKILGKGCFVKDTPVLMANNTFKNAATGMALAAMPLVAPIQDVQVDDMVKAYHHEEMYLTVYNDVNDIYVPGWQDYDYIDITPETWQVGEFIISEADGSLVEIDANRPKKWFEDFKLKKKGDKAFIIIEEMGIADYAVLQDIRSTDIDTRNFTLNEKGKVDRPVITTYKRIAQEISDYAFSNGQLISCTPNHPFYSSDKQTYISVGELTFGELVQSSGDREIKFIGGKAREKGGFVYNFEVWREHNYYVGSKGSEDFVLVHNACPKKLIQDAIAAKVDLRGFKINGKLEIPKDWQSAPLGGRDGFRFWHPSDPKIQIRVRERGTFEYQPHNFDKPYAKYELGKDATGHKRHLDIDGNIIPLPPEISAAEYYERSHIILEDLTQF